MSGNLVFPVILCGGSGTRLWPLSRESLPKQYLSLSSLSEKSLLQLTKERIEGLSNLQNPILICNEEHRFLVAEQMRQIDTNPHSIILEPFGRNTAPAVTIAALKTLKKNEDPILLVLSSDHEITEKERFLEILEIGLTFTKKNKLVTFGIVPKSPETGYGYIKAESPFKNNEITGKKILSFTEKPNLKTAKEFVKDKSYTWNSGIFMFKASEYIKEIQKYSPEIFKYCKESFEKSKYDLDFQRIDKKSFEKCPNLSIDISVMEKTEKGIVIPLNAGWSDIGSWSAVWEVSNKDKNKNFTKGQIVLEDSKECYLRSESRLIVGIGLKELIVIDTKDALLVANKKQSQNLKKIVSYLKSNNISQGQQHTKIYRPWGYYESLIADSKWQVKIIEVTPGESLSLQMHNYRSEHWVVVDGVAKVEIEKKIDTLKKNESIYIPLGSKHRLTNPGKRPLILIEVQSGSYVGEDDIIRFEDKYGR